MPVDIGGVGAIELECFFHLCHRQFIFGGNVGDGKPLVLYATTMVTADASAQHRLRHTGCAAADMRCLGMPGHQLRH
ncbi:MAG: hypothetical protein R3A10_15490 [Caldilineaceae bacterium]